MYNMIDAIQEEISDLEILLLFYKESEENIEGLAEWNYDMGLLKGKIQGLELALKLGGR